MQRSSLSHSCLGETFQHLKSRIVQSQKLQSGHKPSKKDQQLSLFKKYLKQTTIGKNSVSPSQSDPKYYNLTEAQQQLMHINDGKFAGKSGKERQSARSPGAGGQVYSPKFIKGRVNEQQHKIQRQCDTSLTSNNMMQKSTDLFSQPANLPSQMSEDAKNRLCDSSLYNYLGSKATNISTQTVARSNEGPEGAPTAGNGARAKSTETFVKGQFQQMLSSSLKHPARGKHARNSFFRSLAQPSQQKSGFLDNPTSKTLPKTNSMCASDLDELRSPAQQLLVPQVQTPAPAHAKSNSYSHFQQLFKRLFFLNKSQKTAAKPLAPALAHNWSSTSFATNKKEDLTASQAGTHKHAHQSYDFRSVAHGGDDARRDDL